MKMKGMLPVIALMFISLFLGGCYVLTLNGEEPEKIEGENEIYRFTIFVNPYTKSKDINNLAHETAQKLIKSNDCKGYELAEIIPSQHEKSKRSIDYLAILNCQ